MKSCLNFCYIKGILYMFHVRNVFHMSMLEIKKKQGEKKKETVGHLIRFWETGQTELFSISSSVLWLGVVVG